MNEDLLLEYFASECFVYLAFNSCDFVFSLTSNVLDDEATIDIDTYDVSESKTMRDCLTWEASSNQPSPADSSSTTNSGAFISLLFFTRRELGENHSKMIHVLYLNVRRPHATMEN